MLAHRRSSAAGGVTLIELLVVMAILAIIAGAIAVYLVKVGGRARVARAMSETTLISLALERYHGRFRAYPPDTGYGLGMGSSPGTYDPGSLWRYLVEPVRDPGTKRLHEPFLAEWGQESLASYVDAGGARGFYLADPWGKPYGFVAEPKRVLHNQGGFDLFSAGPDGLTASDEAGAEPNLAYDNIDNDGNGTVDDADELGAAAENGARAGNVNNWSPH